MAVNQRQRRAGRTLAGGFLYRPEVRQAIYQVSSSWRSCVRCLLGRHQRRRQPAPAEHRLGLRLPRPHVGLRHLADADRLFQHLQTYGRAFWVGLLNTLLVAGLGIVAGDRDRLRHRHRAALLQLAGRAAGHASTSRSMRNVPLLLQLFFWYFAVLKSLPAPRQSLRAARRRLPQRARALSAGAGAASRASKQWRWRVLHRRGRVHRLVRLGAAAADARPASAFPVLWTSLALDRAACRSASSSLPGQPLGFDYPELRASISRAAWCMQPELDRAAAGPVDLHGELHRRDRARRHPGRVQGPEGGGAGDRPVQGTDRCASSSSRRPCASSSRR